MTKYSTRSAIPGRPGGDEQPSDLDKLIFGEAAMRPVVHPRGGPGGADASPAGDDDDAGFDHDPPPRLLSEANLADRATADRRKAPRRKADYKRLPNVARDRGEPEENRRGMVMLVGTVVVVGVFGAVVWNAYSGGVRSASAATSPVIAASGAFKSRPEGVPAKPAETEQASVFERVESSADAARRAAPAADQRDIPEDDIPPPATTPAVEQATQSAAAPPVADRPTPPQPAVTQAAAPVATQPEATPPARPVQIAATSPPPLKAVEPQPAEAPLAGGFQPAILPNGGYVVQVASLLSESAATDEWKRMAKAWPELFATANSSIVRADVNGETRYRLRVAAFATPADADAFCTALKAKGRDCFRTRK